MSGECHASADLIPSVVLCAGVPKAMGEKLLWFGFVSLIIMLFNL